jgi:hypothetical protein
MQMRKNSIFEKIAVKAQQAASILLVLFSCWCFTVYAEGKWKDSVKFVKNWLELLCQ